MLRVHIFGKIQDWILKSKNGFCVSSLNRFIQDHSVHGTAKEPILDFLKETHPQLKNNSLGFTTDQGIIHYMAWGPNDLSPFGVGENPNSNCSALLLRILNHTSLDVDFLFVLHPGSLSLPFHHLIHISITNSLVT